MNVLSDADLLIRSRTDVESFGELYDRRAPAVHAFLNRRLGRDAADDLLSEVFLRAVEALPRTRLHESGSALPWLYGIARNVLREYIRRQTKRLPRAAHDCFDWSAVDERLDAGQLTGALRAALAGLSDIERDILLLVSWEQLSVTEAAQSLGISPTAARSRLHRARAHAAAALAPSRPSHDQEA